MQFRVAKESLDSDVAKFLIARLNSALASANPDPKAHSWSLSSANVAPSLGAFVVVYAKDTSDAEEVAVGCGAIRKITLDETDAAALGFSPEEASLAASEQTSFVAELKRMFVVDEFRGKRVGSLIVESLKKIAKNECSVSFLLLETADYLTNAVRLYEKAGFKKIQSYGEYKLKGDLSLCMALAI
ncbi:hypothetical protein HK100_001404 [Physocladia obscura]|uniref:N-acetyltransferase domain-containing protein n=1 Tax=Physocladia obscura TaxID=109957 RepID=A0AAD5XBV5_9FUNG|nr:hypothetical protein HK100_001404 [Physocladia obscura]